MTNIRRLREYKNAHQKRIMIDLYKLENGCVDCGYKQDAHALEFDHLPGTNKRRTVASLMYHGMDKIWDEIGKCELVCANCHAIRTYNRKNAGVVGMADTAGLEPAD